MRFGKVTAYLMMAILLGTLLPTSVVAISPDDNEKGNRYSYIGREFEEETGSYCLVARHYNPKNGVFLSTDPIAGNIKNPQSLNRYSYGLNNPLKYIDPNGREPITAALIGLGIAEYVIITAGVAVATHYYLRATDPAYREFCRETERDLGRVIDESLMGVKDLVKTLGNYAAKAKGITYAGIMAAIASTITVKDRLTRLGDLDYKGKILHAPVPVDLIDYGLGRPRDRVGPDLMFAFETKAMAFLVGTAITTFRNEVTNEGFSLCEILELDYKGIVASTRNWKGATSNIGAQYIILHKPYIDRLLPPGFRVYLVGNLKVGGLADPVGYWTKF